MEKLYPYIFYQTDHSLGLCKRELWNKYRYEHEINPIVISMLDCTAGYIKELMDIFDIDQPQFVERIKDEMEQDEMKIFSS